MENEDNLKAEEASLPLTFHLGESSIMDFFEQSETNLEENSGTNADTGNNRAKKEFEYNQFFIFAETSSLPETNTVHLLQPDISSEVAFTQSESSTDLGQAFAESDNCEYFHGILESDGVAIMPTMTPRRDKESSSSPNNGADIIVRSMDEMDGGGNDQNLDDEADKSSAGSATLLLAQSFLNDIKHHSETRSKMLEEVSCSSSVDVNADTTNLKTEFQLIEKLDMKIQELENTEPSTCSSRLGWLSQGSKGVPSAVLYLRDEKKRWKRQQLLKKAVQKLDMAQSWKSSKHILRNVLLGPRARYFSLTKEEEDIVEEILSRPDFFEEETSEGNSTSSSNSTAFDLEGEDALRMAEIDERLEKFIEIHSQCGSPSLTSVTLSIQKQRSVCSQNSHGAMRTPSLECNASSTHENEDRTRLFATSVEDYLSEKKESRKHQEKVESIDKRLRELIREEVPSKLPKEHLDMLISQCMMEQNLEVTMRPFLCLKT